ncbi:27674_t:CDS:2, partial [Racocetra persica]
LDQSDATTITTKLIWLFQSYDIIDKLVAFASNGASVIIGCKNALACKDSQKQIDYFNNAKTIIRNIYKYYKNSEKRVHILQEYQQILDCHLASLNKFFQKSNLYFRDIIPIIDVTTTIIQKDYLVDTLDVRNHYLGYNLQLFIDHTNLFNKQTGVNYHTYLLIYNNHDFDDLFQDIYKYASTIITEIKERFSDHPLLAAMRILNPVEWPRKKEELFEFGDNELQILFDHYGTAKTINGQKFLPLIDELHPFLVRDYFDIFPNMIKLAHITNSIPFSSVDCEHEFSKQNTIKTHL